MQVLLSQVHRLRALVLLGRFLDMGRWAVDLALSVGIFPYVLKLLQTTAPDLRQTLVFIWTKILALDRSCQASYLLLQAGAAVLEQVMCHASSIADLLRSSQRCMPAFTLTCQDVSSGNKLLTIWGQKGFWRLHASQLRSQSIRLPHTNTRSSLPLRTAWAIEQ